MIEVNTSGMLVNSDKEVIGWVNKGDNVELKNGDSIVSHHKTAEKMGLLEKFNEMKAENKPVKAPKAPKADGEGKVRSPRVAVPKTGTYTVVKIAAMPEEGDTSERAVILRKLLTGTSFDAFWDGVAEKFSHPTRAGEMQEFATSGLVGYAIRRGMITIDA